MCYAVSSRAASLGTRMRFACLAKTAERHHPGRWRAEHKRDEALRCVSVWSVRTDAAAIAAANRRRGSILSSCSQEANTSPCAATAAPSSGAGTSNLRALHTEPHRREQRASLPSKQAVRCVSLVRWSPHLALAALADVESVPAACDGSAPATSAAPPARRSAPPRRWLQIQYRLADRVHRQYMLAAPHPSRSRWSVGRWD